MLKLAGTAVLSIMLSLQGCNLRSLMAKGDNAVRSQAQQALTPYFPAAKIVVAGNPKTLFGLTCVENLGPVALQQIQAVVNNNQGVRELKEFGPFLGYRFFALGFEHHLIMLDLQTGRSALMPTSQFTNTTQYENQYHAACSSENEESSTSAQSINDSDQPQFYIGKFKATVRQANGQSRQLWMYGSLGMFVQKSAFENARDAEIAARSQLIKETLQQKGFQVDSLDLVSIKAGPSRLQEFSDIDH